MHLRTHLCTIKHQAASLGEIKLAVAPVADNYLGRRHRQKYSKKDKNSLTSTITKNKLAPHINELKRSGRCIAL